MVSTQVRNRRNSRRCSTSTSSKTWSDLLDRRSSGHRSGVLDTESGIVTELDSASACVLAKGLVPASRLPFQLQNLTEVHLDNLVTELLDHGRRIDNVKRKGLSPRTVNQVLMLVGSLLADAVRQGPRAAVAR